MISVYRFHSRSSMYSDTSWNVGLKGIYSPEFFTISGWKFYYFTWTMDNKYHNIPLPIKNNVIITTAGKIHVCWILDVGPCASSVSKSIALKYDECRNLVEYEIYIMQFKTRILYSQTIFRKWDNCYL